MLDNEYMDEKLSWETLDHIKENKSSDWFWIIGIIAIAGSFLAIFFNNILLGLIILLSAFASFMFVNTPGRLEDYELNKKGVRIGKVLYPHNTLKSYCVVDEDGFDRDRILIKSEKLFMPILIIPLGNEVTVDEVDDFLEQYIEQEEMREPPTYHIMSWLGF
jgi:hypothetical protein